MVVDMGGTSVRVAVEVDGRLLHAARVPTAELGGDAAPWLRAWLDALPMRPCAAGIAVAGPVTDPARAALTNARLALETRDLGLPAVLLNDLHAAAMGVDRVPAEGLVHLGGPTSRPGLPLAVLGVGTGLGEAVRLGEVVLPGEGGHAAFAPVDDEQLALHAFLRQRHGYVDWEHVASGSALVDLLAFAEAVHGRGPQVAAALAAGRPVAAVVVDLAAQDPACGTALRLCLTALGVEAGNMALRHLAQGGLWLVGGVAARLRPWLTDGPFHQAFLARGRFTALAAQVPRMLVLDDDVGLRGAAVVAGRLRG